MNYLYPMISGLAGSLASSVGKIGFSGNYFE